MANDMELELEQDAQEYTLDIDDDTARYLGLEFENEIDVINTGSSAKVYDGVLTIKQGDVAKGTFSANSSSDVTIALDEYAPLVSPAFTGTPTAPTASAGDSTTTLATTAFVTDAVNTAIVEVENGTY